jgi:hypothetical protein
MISVKGVCFMSPTRLLATAFTTGRVRRALNAAAVVLLAACGGGRDPVGTISNGSIRGTVADNNGAAVSNVAVELTGNGQAVRTTNSGANGVYDFADVPPGTYALAITPPTGFTLGSAGTASVTVASGAQASAPAFVLNRVTANGVYTFANVPTGTYTLTVTPPLGYIPGAAGTASVTVTTGVESDASALVLTRIAGEWGMRAPLLVANSEFALAEANGKLYVMGGYPASRQLRPARCRSTTSRATAGSSDRISRSPTTTGWRPPSMERST